MIRKVIAYKNHFIDFYKSQETKVQEKIGYVLDLVRFEKHVPSKFFKKVWITQTEFMKFVSLRLLKAFGFFAFSIKEI